MQELVVAMSDDENVEDLKAQLEAARRKIAILEARANEDPLLGVLNRRGFVETLERAISFCTRYNTRAALVYCDLDDFKAVNDSHGHDVGDRVLEHTVMVFEENMRLSDRIGRVGGDEFALLFWQADIETGKAKAQMLRDLLAGNPLALESGEIVVRASFGAAELRPEDTPTTVLSRADTAMYADKRAAKAEAQEG